MDVAFITPIGLLEDMYDYEFWRPYHMILPEQVDNKMYREFYKTAYHDNTFKILDNGAAEYWQLEDADLIKLAFEFQVNEIVVPDVMGDAQSTAGKVASFAFYAAQHADLFSYMGVVQGKTVEELKDCLALYIKLPWITTIGFPRCLQQLGKDTRVQMIEAFQDVITSTGKAIHCLGATQDPLEVLKLRKLKVRSIDTCMPIDFAIAGISLEQITDPDNILRYMGRHENFFEWTPKIENYSLVVDNCATYAEWADAV